MGDVQKEEYVLQDLYINEIERKPCENCDRVVQLCHDQVIAPYFFKIVLLLIKWSYRAIWGTTFRTGYTHMFIKSF